MDHKYAKLFAGAATVALAATSFGTAVARRRMTATTSASPTPSRATAGARR